MDKDTSLEDINKKTETAIVNHIFRKFADLEENVKKLEEIFKVNQECFHEWREDHEGRYNTLSTNHIVFRETINKKIKATDIRRK